MSMATAYSLIVVAVLTAQTSAQGWITDVEGQDGAGGNGSSSGSVTLSSAGMIVLCTIGGVVVLIGISTTALFLVAKRRQWAMREVITRSAQRATQAIKTPLSARFPKSQTPRDETSSDNLPSMHDEERTRKQKMANLEGNDIEKNAAVNEQETIKNGKTARSWGSFFTFGRA
ncbi:hypothetical protein BDV25DRAFT_165235 [Aspergillus avenaceus]|uniref:Transmembrane protein n=1 Tax=Aspergillus avenaceus TaxID=36643 RepID=A0A5N6TFS4_ASPAV|nr:hypothetical protein BDV25DRAFT_165235 [Aspergillus avenaceus]